MSPASPALFSMARDMGVRGTKPPENRALDAEPPEAEQFRLIILPEPTLPAMSRISLFLQGEAWSPEKRTTAPVHFSPNSGTGAFHAERSTAYIFYASAAVILCIDGFSANFCQCVLTKRRRHTKHRTGPKYRSIRYKKDRIDVFSQLTLVMQAAKH